MRISEIDNHTIFLKQQLKVVEKEIPKYRNAAYLFLKAESAGKMDRYGKNYYYRNYLKNSHGKCSDFMKTFLYLESMEKQLDIIRKNLIQKINNIDRDGKKGYAWATST